MPQYAQTPGYQALFQANGQGVNRGSVLSGLRHDSQTKFNTGSKDGDRGAADAAKSNLYQAQANMGREMTKKNAQFHGQLQDQKEQLTQQGRQLQMQWAQQQLQQRQAKMQLGFRQATDQNDLSTQFQTGLMGLIT